jgi:DNA-binding response OmpR family regulator
MNARTPRILIVDDEPNIRHVLERTLHNQGYLLDLAASGEEALRQLPQQSYDLILLDLRMQDVGGVQVLREARRLDPAVIVIILTAHGSLESAVDALRLGAFDYLFKPAAPAAIRARVKEGLEQRQRALQREALLSQIDTLKQLLLQIDQSDAQAAPAPAERRFLRHGLLTMDLHHRHANFAGREVELTTTEFDLLACLVSAAPEPVSARVLLMNALGYESEEAEAREIIKWHIYQLRQKIEPDPAKPACIKTVRYKGYLWSGG